ncbi:hypothetical protein AK812_SmicGene44547 [Symbiodinium microadriaticum]|uniref:Uncharacterized protein n=1 Tax=Symbiodinium microadriaticum TaxID=2951 RepID=A0A1Q9BY64_SYMMI|nr:hypothetical protein AK812_SmicGene44547 [Symbiodinium microadriaticum]
MSSWDDKLDEILSQALQLPFVVESVSERDPGYLALVEANHQSRLRRVFQSIEDQLAFCQRSPQQRVDLLLTGSPCNPFSTARAKRFRDGNVQMHQSYNTTMQMVTGMYKAVRPIVGVTEQVEGFDMLMHSDSGGGSVTPLEELTGLHIRFLKIFSRDMEAVGISYWLVKLHMDSAIWIKIRRPRHQTDVALMSQWDDHLNFSDESDNEQPLPPAASRARGRGRGSSAFRSVAAERFERRREPEEAVVAVPAGQRRREQGKALVATDLQKRLGTDLQQAVVAAAEQQWHVASSENLLQARDFHMKGLHSTSAAAASMLQMPVKQVRHSLLELAWIMTAGAAWLWGGLLSSLRSALPPERWRPIMAFRKVRFDETPTALRTEDREEAEAALFSSMEWHDSTKVVQIEAGLGFLYEDVSSGSFVLLQGQLPSALRAVDSPNGENFFAAVESVFDLVPDLHRAFLDFPFKVFHACTDAAGANFRSEAASKAKAWNLAPPLRCVRLHLYCELHKVALCAKAVNDLAAHDTAGVLAVGLACATPGSARKMRRILKAFFKLALVVRYEECPAQPLYNRQVLDLYLPVGDGGAGTSRLVLRRRFLLSYFMNGDWQSSDIVHYARNLDPQQEHSVREAFAHYCSWALVPSKCPKYSRGRWTQYDKALQWTGLLASVHSLLPYLMTQYRGGSAEETRRVVQEHQPRGQDLGGWDAVLDEAMNAPDPGQEASAAADSVGAGAAKDPTLFDWTAFNQQQRAEAAKWASSDPVARVAVNLQVVNSLLQLTYDFLELDSARWDQQQRARAAGEDTRDYPLLSVARGTHVGQCVSGLLEMLTHPPRGVPFLKQTRSTRAFYCVTLSAGLCAVQAQLHMRHAACPIALFRADAESSQAFHQLPPCMHDEFARALHKMYPTQPAKSSSECAAVLAACAALASTDIGSVEASHASNRDVAKLRASGWTPTLAFVAGKFVLRKTKLSKERTAGFQHKHFLSKDAKCRAARRRRQRRPGGAWRAFVHEQQRLHRPGAKFDPDFLRQLGVQYRALPAAEKLRLQQVGFLANAAGRHGFQPFGPSQRQAQPPPLQVGDVTEAGAIVAPPPVTVEDVQVGGRTFEELLLREQQQWPARRDRQQEQRREVDLLVKHADRSELQKEVCAALKGHGVDTVLTELFEAVPGSRLLDG